MSTHYIKKHGMTLSIDNSPICLFIFVVTLLKMTP